MTPHSRQGFTLIELLIVSVIVGFFFSVSYTLYSRVRDAGDHHANRMTFHTAASRILREWREDVTFCQEARVEADGQAMALLRFDPDGNEQWVRYERGKSGVFLRRFSPQGNGPEMEILSHDVVDVHFEPVEQGFRVRWGVAYSDGVKTMRWEKSGMAAPLFREK